MNIQPNQIKERDLEEFERYWQSFVKEVISHLRKTIKKGKDLNDSKERIKQLDQALQKSLYRWREKAEKNFLKKYHQIDGIRYFENNYRDIAKRWVEHNPVKFVPLNLFQLLTVSLISSLLLLIIFFTEKLTVGVSLTIGILIIFIVMLKNRQKNWVTAKKKYIQSIKNELDSEKDKIKKEIINHE